MRYDYWVLRYVPSAVRQEFVNVGVIVGSDEPSEWGLRRVENFARASELGGRVDYLGEAIDEFAAMLGVGQSQEALWHVASDPRGYLETLRIHGQNTLQISPPRILSAASIDEALELAFGAMVIDPQKEPTQRGRTRIRKIVGQRMNEFAHASGVTIDRLPRIESSLGTEQMDFALSRDSSPSLVTTWSFEGSEVSALHKRVAALMWHIGQVRVGRANLLLRDNERAHFDPDSLISIVHDGASLEVEARREVFEACEDQWKALEVQTYSIDEFEAGEVQVDALLTRA